MPTEDFSHFHFLWKSTEENFISLQFHSIQPVLQPRYSSQSKNIVTAKMRGSWPKRNITQTEIKHKSQVTCRMATQRNNYPQATALLHSIPIPGVICRTAPQLTSHHMYNVHKLQFHMRPQPLCRLSLHLRLYLTAWSFTQVWGTPTPQITPTPKATSILQVKAIFALQVTQTKNAIYTPQVTLHRRLDSCCRWPLHPRTHLHHRWLYNID